MSLNRLSTYLNEDEVDEQVSSLKKTNPFALDEIAGGLGLDHATFKWNEVEVKKDQVKDYPAKSSSANESSIENGSDTTVESTSVTEVAEGERRFELTDVSVMFPEGELTVITGPTGSGKTALLVRIWGTRLYTGYI